ncbi:hypothetical protein D9M70_437870 [compost metagenome]
MSDSFSQISGVLIAVNSDSSMILISSNSSLVNLFSPDKLNSILDESAVRLSVLPTKKLRSE